MHLVIRADGGPSIGFGHLFRSTTIAEKFGRNDSRVTYATTTPSSVERVCPAEVEIVELHSRSDPDPFVEWLVDVEPDIVVSDAYPVDTPYQQAVREYVPLVVISDDTRHAVNADILINGNLYAKNLQYEFVENEPLQCVGPAYALLREPFQLLAGRDPPWRTEPERALVTMGGSDTTNRTPAVIQAFDGLSIRVDAIVGPGFSNEQEWELRDVANNVSADVRLERDPDDLSTRMFRADFAVCTASTTTYELLAIGTPIVCQPIADNQDRIATALSERDVATILERDANVDSIRRAITAYTTDETLRRERREIGQTLVDGRGADRVTTAMQTLLK
ncbi:UDP-2,4-diacetamido-2,4,6-trideoxy-beta-L-altropyranose hydrolase [Natrarchaeobius sp. A-rgal3]|uniref:UDP-2,4-diacetamido-2,4, 6-trideoxy-beta-L-altropyranose hydrolase n=1 Tax=Natrarchaeobius versutus TaxID=1679078 RepID=UPI00351027BB